MKKIVILTGAGISAESGISTFRDSGGLWEKYDLKEVAHIDAWDKNPEKVLNFYNQRRTQMAQCLPNAAHLALVALEKKFDVQIITQNIDDLHEKAGSTNILHLHGKICEVRSTTNPNLIYNIEYNPVKWGDTCPEGSQLRPNIVWFGEEVPAIELAIKICQTADIIIIIGTSMIVYPAASLVHFAPTHTPVYVVNPDPNSANSREIANLHFIQQKASVGVPELVSKLLNE